jgi:hypothetical protein
MQTTINGRSLDFEPRFDDVREAIAGTWNVSKSPLALQKTDRRPIDRFGVTSSLRYKSGKTRNPSLSAVISESALCGAT